jgi:putative colanic acid biosynthesis UDP-glucose lipid carrier transferase
LVRLESNPSKLPKATASGLGAMAGSTPAPDALSENRGLEGAATLPSFGGRLAFSLTEAVTVVLASLLSHAVYQWIVVKGEGPILVSFAVGVMAGILYAGSMHIIDNARRLRGLDGREALGDVTMAWIFSCLLITFFAFSLKEGASLSRGTLLTFFVAGYGAIIVARSVAPKFISKHLASLNRSNHKVLAIGVRGDAALARLVGELKFNGNPNISLAELPARLTDAEWNADLPTTLANIFAMARETGYGDICIAAGGLSSQRLKDVIDATKILPQAVYLVPDTAEEELLHSPIRNVGRLRSFEMQKAPMNLAQRIAKRAMDLAISIPLAIVLSPFLLLLALAVRLDSAGPVLFVQRRLGYRGKIFKILKFRTMTVLEDGSDVRQIRKGDTQITRLGRVLRKSSLDELPQLFNVIEGSMSLVGPRPHAVAHDLYFSELVEHYEVRQHVKPGVTGLAQVNGYRGETATSDEMKKRVELDIVYAKTASVWLDVKILLMTIPQVLRQRNAY